MVSMQSHPADGLEGKVERHGATRGDTAGNPIIFVNGVCV